jgi:branched-chain amino acid transport system ATP-binding protein
LAKTKGNILRVADLSVSYGELSAIRQVSLEVNEGELVALLGANGSGKSTLIAAVLGVVRAKSGTIWFLDNDVTRKSTDYIVGSGISVVPEGRGVLPLMTVMENLQLGAYHTKGDIDKRLNWIFERFPILAERKNMLAGMLSGGQQQILDIGRALMGSPRLIMMDEPSLGLAPSLVSELFRILLDLKKEGQTILLAEQNARKALQCADRAYIFEVGSIVFEGTVQELARDPRLQQAYLGNV